VEPPTETAAEAPPAKAKRITRRKPSDRKPKTDPELTDATSNSEASPEAAPAAPPAEPAGEDADAPKEPADVK
jgi:hypothetical protein